MSAGEACFHCREPVLTGDRYRVTIDDEPRRVCCPGCQAVATLIRDAGLELTALYGEFDGSPYEEHSSPNLIAVARRAD